MAKKSSGGFNGRAGKWQGDSEFATAALSRDDETVFRKWLETVSEDFSSALQRCADDLYRVSFKADINNNCFMVTFTQQDEKHHNAGLIVSSRSDDVEEAFWLTVYKIYVMFADQRLPTEKQDRSWG